MAYKCIKCGADAKDVRLYYDLHHLFNGGAIACSECLHNHMNTKVMKMSKKEFLNNFEPLIIDYDGTHHHSRFWVGNPNYNDLLIAWSKKPEKGENIMDYLFTSRYTLTVIGPNK